MAAAVVESARAARQRLTTAVRGGDKSTARLDKFLVEAEKMDVLGPLFGKLHAQATSAAKQAVEWAWKTALGLSAPPTIAALTGAVLAIGGFFTDLGRSIGEGLVALATGLAVLVSRNPGQASRMLYVGGRLVAGVQAGAQWADRNFVSAVRTSDNLGRGAAALLEKTLAPAARTFFGEGTLLPGWQVPAQTRSAAKFVLNVSAAVVLVCVGLVGYGIYRGIDEASTQPNKTSVIPLSPFETTPSPRITSCLAFPRGTCLGR